MQWRLNVTVTPLFPVLLIKYLTIAKQRSQLWPLQRSCFHLRVFQRECLFTCFVYIGGILSGVKSASHYIFPGLQSLSASYWNPSLLLLLFFDLLTLLLIVHDGFPNQWRNLLFFFHSPMEIWCPLKLRGEDTHYDFHRPFISSFVWQGF